MKHGDQLLTWVQKFIRITQVDIIFKVPFRLGVIGELKALFDNFANVGRPALRNPLFVVCFQLKYKTYPVHVDPIVGETFPRWKTAQLVEVVYDQFPYLAEAPQGHECLPPSELLPDGYLNKRFVFVGNREAKA